MDDPNDSDVGEVDAESVKQGVVISGNRLSDCGGGIAAFGGRRIAITGNEIERSRLRGIVVGVAASQPNISHAITISGNTITDVINRNTIDALSDGNRYITILSTVQAGTGIAVPGLPSGAGTFESMDAALLTNAAGGPLAPASWITVSGNVLARTLVAGGSYSSYGHGNMFTRNGYLNPTITEAMLSTTAVGVYAENGLRDSVIASNVIRGVNSGVLFGGAVNDLENVTIHGNVLVRFGSAGVAFDSAVTNGKNIEVSDNIFDGDPYHEHANRGSGGTWAASGAPVGVFVQNAKGVIARNNTFRRVCRLSDKLSNAGTDNALFSGNVYDCEPAALGFSTSNVGVGEIPRGSVKAIARIVDSNPTSATYGLTLNVCQTDKSSIPTTGAYVAGHFVHNNGASVLAPYGWQRATTGSNHVLGTDWVAIADPFLRPAVGSTLTIATGVVTATATVHAVDTEAAAATDDLDTINGLSSGQLLVLRAASGSRTIVAKDGTGNLRLAGDFSLDNADDRLVLISDGTNLLEVSRSDNAT